MTSFVRSPASRADQIKVVFEPVIDLGSNGVVAVAARATHEPTAAGPRSVEPSDVALAVHAARAAARHETLLPLHLALRAHTVAYGGPVLAELRRVVSEIGRRPREVIVEIEGDVAGVDPLRLRSGLSSLRQQGYLVGLAGFGASPVPLELIAESSPFLIKAHPSLVRAVPGDERRTAIVEALLRVGRRSGVHVLIPAVATERQLAVLRKIGARLVQGPLFAPPEWRPPMRVTVPVSSAETVSATGWTTEREVGPRVSDFMVPALMLPSGVTADAVREALAQTPTATSVVLVDEAQRPLYTIDRTRFLLSVAGPYGHALHAKRPAIRLAEHPRLVPRTVPAIVALRAAGQEADRVYDDLVVADETGRCIGVVRVGDLIRSLAEASPADNLRAS